MRYVTGYDRDFSRQFFLRTFQELAPQGRFFSTTFLPEEFTYMATRLSETMVFSRGEYIGCPWEKENPEQLAWRDHAMTSQLAFQKTERAANQLLIREGLVRKNIANLMATFHREASRKTEVTERLYRNASQWPRLTDSERTVLRRMSFNVTPWMELLSLIPDNDYFVMMANQPSPLLIN
jgi:hypothetical protein